MLFRSGGSFEARRVYGKTFRDATGRPIALDGPVFRPGVTIDTDSRIKPDERRVEVLPFPVSPTASAYVTLKLYYEHTPTAGDENRTFVTFYTEDRRYTRVR